MYNVQLWNTLQELITVNKPTTILKQNNIIAIDTKQLQSRTKATSLRVIQNNYNLEPKPHHYEWYKTITM